MQFFSAEYINNKTKFKENKMTWYFYLLFTVLAWGGYNILYRFATDRIDFAILLMLVGAVHAITAVPWVIINYTKKQEILYTAEGIGIAVLMGILMTLGGITFSCTFKLGVPVSVATPTYSVGVMLLSVIVGVFLGELMTLTWFMGIVSGVISVILLTTK